MAVRKELIEELLANRNPEEVFAQDGLLDELKKALAERILNAEMDQHLAAERADEVIGEPRNHRNGHSRKTVLTGTGKLDLQVPRDRQASFEPQLIAKYRRRFPDFDDKVVSLYARGMTVREIQGHLRELYGVEVSPDLTPPLVSTNSCPGTGAPSAPRLPETTPRHSPGGYRRTSERTIIAHIDPEMARDRLSAGN